MIEIIYIVGPPGSGKTYGGRTLDATKTVWINSDKKALTFPGAYKKYKLGKNMSYDLDFDKITKGIISAYTAKDKTNNPLFDYAVWDTPNNCMTYKEMADTKNLTWSEWYNLAKDVIGVIYSAKDLIESPRTKPFYLFILFHEGYDSNDRKNVLTSGKKLNNIQLEGQVNWCFFTKVSGDEDNPQYELETMAIGKSTAKQMGRAFPYIIPNDYKYIIEGIEKYKNSEQE